MNTIRQNWDLLYAFDSLERSMHAKQTAACLAGKEQCLGCNAPAAYVCTTCGVRMCRWCADASKCWDRDEPCDVNVCRECWMCDAYGSWDVSSAEGKPSSTVAAGDQPTRMYPALRRWQYKVSPIASTESDESE